MAEEIKEPEATEEDESTKEETSEEAEAPKKDDFEKDEFVPAGKYNQAVRKQREIELEKRELEKQLAEAKATKGEPEEDEEKEEESFFKEDEEKEKAPDPSKLIDEKLKPILEAQKKRDENDKKLARTAFFEAHPEYLNDSEKWQGLLDEMDNSLNPNSKDDYYTQLEKAHRIIAGDTENAEVEKKKTEWANDAASGGDGAEKGSVKDEFTAEERRHQKEWGISDEGMRAYKKKLESGSMQILSWGNYLIS